MEVVVTEDVEVHFGGNASDFMVGSTGGVTSSNGLGYQNYVDQWGEKWKVTGSYIF